MKVSANKGIIYLSTTKPAEFTKLEKLATILGYHLEAIICEDCNEELYITLSYDSKVYTVREIKDSARQLAKEL